MNFLNDGSGINTWGTKYFDGNPSYNDINLRTEFSNILNGSAVRRPLGHWIVYRRYDRSRPSKYWDARTKEAVGGPAYEFTDELVRARRMMPRIFKTNEQMIKAGITFADNYIYYLEHNMNPMNGDEIFELRLDNHLNKPSYDDVTLHERYVIIKTHDYRMEDGTIQYWAAISEFCEVKY